MTRNRLWAGMAAYAALGLLAALTLDGAVRIAVWLFFFALAVKTWIAFKRDN